MNSQSSSSSPRGGKLSKAIDSAMQALVLRSTYGKSSAVTPEQLWSYVASIATRERPIMADLLLPLPILKYWPSWLPGGRFHAVAEGHYQAAKAIWEAVRDDVKAGLVGGCTVLLRFQLTWHVPSTGTRQSPRLHHVKNVC